MSKEDTIRQILYLCNNTNCLGLDEDPLEVILNWLPLQEIQIVKNELEQLYIKDLLNNEDSEINDVGIEDNGTFIVSYSDGTQKRFEAGLDKDILEQTCWEPIHSGYYKREIK